MTRAPAESKRDFQAFLLFPGISEEPQWRPEPAPPVKRPPPQEDRGSDEDIERWDGLA
jgi:hypothetical protein